MSKKELNENFIYKFKLKNKSKSIKQSKSNAITIFNKFINFYIQQNQKKKSSFPVLTISKYEFKESRDKKTFYYFVITRPYTNHPFTIFSQYNSDIVNIIIPVGKEIGQFNIHKITKHLKYLNKDECKALKELLTFTVKLRKFNFLNQQNPENKFFNCSNLIQCDKQVKYVNKQNISMNKKIKIINKIYNTEYNEIVANLKSYFNFLKENDFKNAKKKLNDIKNMYHKTKDIVGHLNILIDIYKLIQRVKQLI